MTMEYVDLKIGQIKPYQNNPRKNDKAVWAVTESIKQCGYISPIVVDEDYVILAGHTRYKALFAMNVKEVKCLRVIGLTEEAKKKYRFLDNKTGEAATWDLIKLENELEGLDLEGFDLFGVATSGTVIGDGPAEEPTTTGSQEYSTEEYGDEQFAYQCPKCGFRFN